MTRRHLLLALASAVVPRRAGAQVADTAGEYQVKSAFLYNFTKFVEWPTTALAASAPLSIAVIGESPMLLALGAVAGKVVNGHRIDIRSYSHVRSADYCHIVFFAAGPRPQLVQQLTAVAAWPSLVVGESGGFARDGGTVNFVVVEGRVSFEVNLAAAERAGLQISSRLLRLATIVDAGRSTAGGA